MKKGLMNNWGLKILSFLLAVMLWLIVVNIDDPVTTQTFNNIPVAVTNAEVLAATNQTYQIEDGTQNVSVTVRAKRSVLNKIKADKIKATADMKELTLQTQIPIDIEIEGISYEDVEVTPRNLQVKLEDEETKKFPIVPKTTGTVRDGCALGEIQAVPEMVSIRGPKSVIDSISKVEASVSVSGLSEDVVTKSELVLYDSDNNVIDQSLLANNLGTEGVSVSVQVLETKSVKVEFDTSQITAADGYSVSDIKYEPDHVNVTGRAEELKKLNAQKLKQYDLLEQGIYTSEIFLERSSINAQQIQSCTKSIEDLQVELEHDQQLLAQKNTFIPRCENLLSNYWSWDAKTRNDVLKELIERIDYSKDTKNAFRKGNDITFSLDIYPKIQ